MTQKEVDVVFNITIMIYEHEWFKEKKRTRDEVQAWVADQLAKACNIYTIPIGMSWGSIVSEERYNEYHKEKQDGKSDS